MYTKIPLRRANRSIASINMVPFIDVMLVLLIIFMVTAPLLTPGQIDLPSIGKASDGPQEVVQVEIDKNQKVLVKAAGVQVIVDLDSLADSVQKAQTLVATSAITSSDPNQVLLPKQVPVVISADKVLQYNVVIRAMDKLQRVGVERVGLAVQLNDAPS